jgi:uncharacterized protein (UPF0262 family)
MPAHLIAVEIDPASLAPARPVAEAERAAGIRDLIAENTFAPAGAGEGAFRLALSLIDGKLALDIAAEDGAPIARHLLSLTPLRRVLKDYHLVCEAYYAAASGEVPMRIEAVDVGRRGLHNEGAEILRERLEGKVSMDFATARRLFTLVSALHRKG